MYVYSFCLLFVGYSPLFICACKVWLHTEGRPHGGPAARQEGVVSRPPAPGHRPPPWAGPIASMAPMFAMSPMASMASMGTMGTAHQGPIGTVGRNWGHGRMKCNPKVFIVSVILYLCT